MIGEMKKSCLSGQDSLASAQYMLALGYYGMGDEKRALNYLAEVEALDNNHLGIQQLRTLIDFLSAKPHE